MIKVISKNIKGLKLGSFYSVLLAFIISVSFTSCVDWLDVRPESDQVLEDYWQNESQVNQVLAACYRSMLEDDFLARVMVWGELRSDNVVSGSDTPDDMFRMINVDITTSNGYVGWTPMYRTINYCNNWLYFSPDVMDLDPNFTKAKYQMARAEVLTIRALSYFYLVRTYKEVPWISTPSIDDSQDYNIAKSSEDAVLDSISSDLRESLNYITDEYDVEDYNKGRVTKNLINSLLADISLWRNDYQAAVNYCDAVLADKTLYLEEREDVLDNVFYLGNSTESIFELQYMSSGITNNIVRDYLGYYGRELGYWKYPFNMTQKGGPFNYEASAGVIEGEDDIRKTDYIQQIDDETFYPFKYVGLKYESTSSDGSSYGYSYRIDWSNWVVYRLSDIILMKAEALYEIGNNDQGVIDLVNETFLRSNPITQDSLRLSNYQGVDLRNLVLRERQRELMWEGKRWFDLMRLARREDSPSTLVNYVLKKFGGSGDNVEAKMSVMDALYLPIHIDEIKANSALEQNPFYQVNSSSSTGN
nr:RagB/SusD family nutrient uptake outer membrane protein [uncultured Carboxylicivirga sp.]